MPASRLPSGVVTESTSAPRGNGPAGATACVGKIRCDWNSNITGTKAAASVPREMKLSLSGQCRVDGRCYAVNSVGLLNHGRVIELGRRRIDVTTRRDHEWHVLLAECARNGPDVLALQVHVEDRKIEAAFLHLGECAFYGVAGPLDLMPKGIEEILEHHRNQRLILDDEDRTRSFHRRLA